MIDNQLPENQTESPLPDTLVPDPANQPHREIVGACLVISLTIHIVTVVAVLMLSLQHRPGPTVTYIDLNRVAESVPATAPVIRAPEPRSEDVQPDRPVPVPEQPVVPAAPEKPAAAVPTTREVLATSLGRGMASGYFSSFAEGKNLRDDIRDYYFVLLEKINVQWWLKAETLTETAAQDGVVVLAIGRDGAVVDVELQRSSGSREVDRAIIQLLRDTAPYPPLPPAYTLDVFQAPLKIAAPLHLFGAGAFR